MPAFNYAMNVNIPISELVDALNWHYGGRDIGEPQALTATQLRDRREAEEVEALKRIVRDHRKFLAEQATSEDVDITVG